jgi:hypothetical protein
VTRTLSWSAINLNEPTISRPSLPVARGQLRSAVPVCLQQCMLRPKGVAEVQQHWHILHCDYLPPELGSRSA